MDNIASPVVALICAKGGIYGLGGDGRKEEFDQSLQELLFETLNHEAGYFMIIPFPETWETKTDSMLEHKMTKKYYRAFIFNPSQFMASGSWRDQIPSEFTLRRIDGHVLKKIQEQQVVRIRFWHSECQDRSGQG